MVLIFDIIETNVSSILTTEKYNATINVTWKIQWAANNKCFSLQYKQNNRNNIRTEIRRNNVDQEQKIIELMNIYPGDLNH